MTSISVITQHHIHMLHTHRYHTSHQATLFQFINHTLYKHRHTYYHTSVSHHCSTIYHTYHTISYHCSNHSHIMHIMQYHTHTPHYKLPLFQFINHSVHMFLSCVTANKTLNFNLIIINRETMTTIL